MENEFMQLKETLAMGIDAILPNIDRGRKILLTHGGGDPLPKHFSKLAYLDKASQILIWASFQTVYPGCRPALDYKS